MQTLGHHVLLVLAVLALAGAGLRLASLAGLTGLDRALGATVVAAALAVAEALGLGLVGLADSAGVLALAAALTWLAARTLVPAAGAGAGAELAAWWAQASRGARAGAGAAAVLAIGWTAWQLRHPLVGLDGFTYHLPLAAAWAQNGHPGSIVELFVGLPVANYPVTNEVLLSWMLGLSRSWVAASTWTVATAVVWLAGVWIVLRELAVAPRTRAYALAALATLPLAVGQLGGPYTDLPAAAWLAACAALALRARSTPQALPLAVVAAGLCLGTKTTPALLVAAALGYGAYRARAHLRRIAVPLGVALGAAAAVGGVWMLRNLVDHGSPLWPFVATSFGDPVPAVLAPIDDSFLDHPGAMLEGRVARYVQTVAGGLVLLAAVPLGMLAARSRAALATGGLAIVAALLWASAPYTGIADRGDDLAVGATRYLLPALTAAAVAVAVAARDAPAPLRRAVHALLALATLLSVVRLADLGFPHVPALATLVVFAGFGALAGLVPVRAVAAVPRAVRAGALAALAAAALALSADGYLARHAESGLPDAALVRALLAQPGFEGDQPIAMGPATVAFVRGDDLAHEVPFLGDGTSCSELRRHLAAGWVVLQHAPPTPAHTRMRACLGDREPAHRDRLYELFTTP